MALTVIYILVAPQSTSDLEYILKTSPGFEVPQIQQDQNSPSLPHIKSASFPIPTNVICGTT